LQRKQCSGRILRNYKYSLQSWEQKWWSGRRSTANPSSDSLGSPRPEWSRILPHESGVTEVWADGLAMRVMWIPTDFEELNPHLKGEIPRA